MSFLLCAWFSMPTLRVTNALRSSATSVISSGIGLVGMSAGTEYLTYKQHVGDAHSHPRTSAPWRRSWASPVAKSRGVYGCKCAGEECGCGVCKPCEKLRRGRRPRQLRPPGPRALSQGKTATWGPGVDTIECTYKEVHTLRKKRPICPIRLPKRNNDALADLMRHQSIVVILFILQRLQLLHHVSAPDHEPYLAVPRSWDSHSVNGLVMPAREEHAPDTRKHCTATRKLNTNTI